MGKRVSSVATYFVLVMYLFFSASFWFVFKSKSSHYRSKGRRGYFPFISLATPGGPKFCPTYESTMQ